MQGIVFQFIGKINNEVNSDLWSRGEYKPPENWKLSGWCHQLTSLVYKPHLAKAITIINHR